MEGEPVTDVSLLRLRFEHQEEDLGQSELRITEGAEGIYSVRGANLSAPDEWQIRMTVQRPEQYDSVVDFAPHVEVAPPPPPAPVIEVETTLPYRTTALVGTGMILLTFGAYFLARQRFRFWQGVGVPGSILVVGPAGAFEQKPTVLNMLTGNISVSSRSHPTNWTIAC